MELHKKTVKRDKVLDKGLLNNLWILVIIMLSIVYFKGESKNDFSTLIKIICATLALLISIIVYSKIPNIKNDFVKYIGIGFLYLGIINFVEIFLKATNVSSSLQLKVSITISWFEFVIIIYSVILYKKKLGFLLSNIIFLGSLVILFILSDVIIEKKIIEYLSSEYRYVIIISIICLTIVTIGLILRDKNIIYKEDKRWLVKITLFIPVYNMKKCLGIVLVTDISYLQNICRVIIYWLAYRYVEKKLLSNSYRETLDKLIIIQKTRKSMNNSLMKKERRLRESRMNIKKSEQRYEEIIESISDGILIFENNILMYINENGREYVFNELTGEVIKKELKYILKLLTNVVIEEHRINEGFIKDFIIANKEKEEINITLTLKNTSDTGKVLLISNTTGLDELQQLRQKRDKAKDMETIKDEFYSNISHELRTPINVINSGLQLNNLMLNDNKLEKMIQNNNIIRRNCLRLIRTANNFIDTNRISEGFLEPNIKVYNIVGIVEAVVLACNKYMILMDNKLVFDTDLEEIYIACDKEHIERIMLNILSNSLKYGKVGGNIDVIIKSGRRGVRIFVRNDAPPIPEEKKKIIFEKFTKLDSSLARPSEGSGLGLYLTKKLVELNEGTIQMNSNVKSGNMFDIRFPFKFSGEPWEVKLDNNEQNLQEKVNIEFSDIYFN
ncbi:sensor histidine kinase [Clostridium gasigenes]|uniref:sensor histidine kinase n=1 Tax=Clostridium gasigenes TaxID=94869 RepID=UPI001C0D4453|nr:ATP-binding protein [Clostridium gasigenes]MBU3134771.1 sensor histidine kinase [Clostridium gasigenes]